MQAFNAALLRPSACWRIDKNVGMFDTEVESQGKTFVHNPN